MKILILVLSFTDEPYLSLMRAQQETWDSIEVEGVRTVYYYGGGKGWVNEKEFSGRGNDSYFYMHDKLLDALIATKDWDYTHIFRTNSSSYCQLNKLKEFVSTLPMERCYAGWEIQGSGSYNVVSGAGLVISKDVANILIDTIDPSFCREEDCVISELLYNAGIQIIDDKTRYDVPLDFSEIPLDRYHYRCKAGGSRQKDAENMRKIHQLIINS